MLIVAYEGTDEVKVVNKNSLNIDMSNFFNKIMTLLLVSSIVLIAW